jgi:ferrous iron transport protein B
MVTMLIIPFMSCSARYPVYVLIISAFFDSFQGTILFGLYLIGIMLAAFMAFLLKRTLFKAKEIPFVMELPPYRMPTLKAVARHTWFKGEQYLRKMGTIILVASVIIWALGYFPRNTQRSHYYDSLITQSEVDYEKQSAELSAAASDEMRKLEEEHQVQVHSLRAAMRQEQQENSIIGRIGKFVEPVITPLGFDWRMGVSLIAGSAAKEVVVSTMGVLYQSDLEDENSGLVDKIRQQEYTSGPKAGQPVFTPLVAFSFMIFILIYFPCIAVIAAIKKESGKWKWSAFVAVYTTVLAWLASFIVYQAGGVIF